MLVVKMKKQGAFKWSREDMIEVCELAGIKLLWDNAKTPGAQKKVVLTALQKLEDYR